MPEPISSPPTPSAIIPETDVDRDRYFDLRWRVLRAPWRQPRGSERDEREGDSIHLMIRSPTGDAMAVGRLHFNSADEAQVRFMAVDPQWQGRGLGGVILRELERRAQIAGATSVVLNARDRAQRFYHRHGYREEGPAETLFGEVAHVRMRKRL